MTDVFKLAKSIVDGNLDLLCPKMELVRCPDYRETAMTGCGVIRSNDRGELSFRLSGSPPIPFPPVLLGDRPQGTMYDIDDHVMLIATDAEGREWRSDPLLVHLRHPGELFRGCVSRKLETLVHCREGSLEDENTVRMFVARQPSLPFDRRTKFERTAGTTRLEIGWAIDHHIRRIGDAEVCFRREEGRWLSVTAKQPTAILPDWPGLMCHALSLATSSSILPVAILRTFENQEQVGIFSGPFHQYRSLMPRPIIGLSPSDADSFWSLVERVFLFAWSKRESSLQFLEELNAVRAGAAMSLQTACLTLAIGIEAIAKELLPAVPPPGWDQDAKASLEAHIRAWDGDAATRDRVLGWLRSKSEPRAVDQLFAWADRVGVKHTLIDHWSELRNRRAHGRSLEEEQPSYDRYYSVVELLYRLIASVVGFEGQVLESSIPGWGEERQTQEASQAPSPPAAEQGGTSSTPETP